jgi:Domain of unknown function (DUF1937)
MIDLNGGYWYLGSPYSKFAFGLEAAYRQVSEAAGLLIRAGVPVFCPIAHSHPIAKYGQLDPVNHELWVTVDAPLVRAAGGLIVLMLPGWTESRGLTHERSAFEATDRPVVYMYPGRLPLELVASNPLPAFDRGATATLPPPSPPRLSLWHKAQDREAELRRKG